MTEHYRPGVTQRARDDGYRRTRLRRLRPGDVFRLHRGTPDITALSVTRTHVEGVASDGSTWRVGHKHDTKCDLRAL